MSDKCVDFSALMRYDTTHTQAGVAERYTRLSQKQVLERDCGFESHHRHTPSTDICGCRFHARFPLSTSTGVVENLLLSGGSPVNFPVRIHRIDIV